MGEEIAHFLPTADAERANALALNRREVLTPQQNPAVQDGQQVLRATASFSRIQKPCYKSRTGASK